VGGGVFTLQGSGADIWDVADGFQFVYQPLTGDGQVVARVTGIGATDAWAKAGVMVRSGLTAGAANAAVVVSAGSGVSFQRRQTTGGGTQYTPVAGTAPTWVKLTRSGNTVSAYRSSDGATWILMGTDSVTLGTTVYVGLAVTSHKNGVLTTGTFDNVAVSAAIL
jgi:hypothetical protein